MVVVARVEVPVTDKVEDKLVAPWRVAAWLTVKPVIVVVAKVEVPV